MRAIVGGIKNGDSRVAKFTIKSGMAHISGFDRSQLLLLPEAIDDYVGMDNPVRFIDTFVEGVDLEPGSSVLKRRGWAVPATRLATC